jgi:pimeloyl-ACP methyl ester carboxylesterase
MKHFVALLTLLAVLAAGCMTNASLATPPAPAATSVPTIAPTATDAPLAPIITPQDFTYTNGDPSFEALPGARAFHGEYAGGIYKIEVPDNWNGEVVYFEHGYRLHLPVLAADTPPLRTHLIENGFAWAASSYTMNGYEPGVAARDTYALRAVFERLAGPPARSYLYGESMGGHIVALMLEQYPNAYDGALSTCGAVAGSEVLDYFLDWSVLAGYFSDVDLWSKSTDGEAFGAAVETEVMPALGPIEALTDDGRAFANAIHQLTGGPRPFFWEGFALSYGANFGVLGDAIAHPGAANVVVQNADKVYEIDPGFGVTQDELNESIARIGAAESYRDAARYPEFAPLTGRISAPFLTLHGTGDLFVPISLEQSYRRTVDAAGRGGLLVQRAMRHAGHCVFSQEELSQGFDDLVSWVRSGTAPAGDNLLGDLTNIGLAFTTPLEDSDPGTTGLAAR